MAEKVALVLRVLVHHVHEDIFCFPHGQQEATTALLLLLAQSQLLPDHVQEQLLAAGSVEDLGKALCMVDEAALDTLRPVLLFLQQWVFRQKELYPQQLAKLSAIFAPLLCPLGQQTGRASQAAAAISLLISNALNIFMPGLAHAVPAAQAAPAQPAPSSTSTLAAAASTSPAPAAASTASPPVAQPEPAAPVQPLHASMQPPPVPRSPAASQRSSSHKASAPPPLSPTPAAAPAVAAAVAAPAIECVAVPDEEPEPWLLAPAFVQLTSALVASTVCSCLFWDEDEEQEEFNCVEQGGGNATIKQQQELDMVAAAVAAAGGKAEQQVPLPSLPQPVQQPLTSMSQAWLEAGDDAEVLCIVRSPVPSLKGRGSGGLGASTCAAAPAPGISLWGFGKCVVEGVQQCDMSLLRSASAPQMGAAVVAAAVAAHSAQVRAEHGALCSDASVAGEVAAGPGFDSAWSRRSYSGCGSGDCGPVASVLRRSRSLSLQETYAAVSPGRQRVLSPRVSLGWPEELPCGAAAGSAAALLPGMLVGNAVGGHAGLLPLPLALGSASIRVG